jgi:hypothetical protein
LPRWFGWKCLDIYHKFCIKNSTATETKLSLSNAFLSASAPRTAIHAAELLGARSLCHASRPSPRWSGARSFRFRPLPVATGSPAHPNVGVNHCVDSLPPLFPGFHAGMLPTSAADQNSHIYRIRREFPTITLSRSDQGELPRSSQWVVLRCACVVASGKVLAGLARMSSVIVAEAWSGPPRIICFTPSPSSLRNVGNVLPV